MSNANEDDLDLLLSLQDRVLETPPGSPSPQSPGYLSDEDGKRSVQVDMSVFKDAVKDCLDYEPKSVAKSAKLKRPTNSISTEVEKFSGLRIRKQLVSSAELGEKISDIRFIRLSAMKNLLAGDTFSGCWATVGVLTEKGHPKTSSIGKSFCIWKVGCLDESTISVFLFGDAYQKNCNEVAGSVFAFFNCSVRKDAKGNGFSLSVFSPDQILKVGTSADYGVCRGKRKDGFACTLGIDKRKGIYCEYHRSKASEKYYSIRSELKGGNLRTAFRDPHNSGGIYLVDPLADKINVKKSQPVKLLSVDALRKALSNAGQVTTSTHSQGIRFLSQVTGKVDSKKINNGLQIPNNDSINKDKRKAFSMKRDLPAVARNQYYYSKRKKAEEVQSSVKKTNVEKEKLIELDYVSSDEDI